MDIYNDGCIDEYGNQFEVAALQGTVTSINPTNGMIELIKPGVGVRLMTYEQFDELFYILNEVQDAALKSDCIFYRVVGVGEVLVKNYNGEERLISMHRFLSMYTI